MGGAVLMILLIILLWMLSWALVQPDTYAECIQKHMIKTRNEAAAVAVMASCRQQFPDT